MNRDARTRSSEETRLHELIRARGQPGADVAAIDALIWNTFGDEGAVMFTDLTGFSRWADTLGITHALQIIDQSQELLIPLVERRGGRVFEAEADSLLLWFDTAVDAVETAVAMQRACHAHNESRLPQDQILLCVGIGYGRVLRAGHERLAGNEVNAASKLGEDIAEAYEILVTKNVYTATSGIVDWQFQRTGISLPGSEDNYRVVY
jgi:adenylate cyclase